MGLHQIRRGLELPIRGEPEQRIGGRHAPRRVALLGDDYPGMRPGMHVQVGDDVRLGQLVFEDKKSPGVRFTAPASGRVVAIHRGERRAFQSLVIEPRRSGLDTVALRSFAATPPERVSAEEARDLLLESGLWTALRGRPFGRVARPDQRPRAIFVTAMDSHPLAPRVEVALAGQGPAFAAGLQVLAKLTDGPVFVCTGESSALPVPQHERIRHERFAGPHPAGTPGLHMHRLDPVDRQRLAWHAGAQDVAAIGRLFTSGEIPVERVVALAGPLVRRPRLVTTRLGASLDDLVSGELGEGEPRVVSGSVLHGRRAMGEVFGYLGRHHSQVSVLREGRERELLGWAGPGLGRFSVMNTFLSKLVPGRRFELTTSTNGSRRAIVPIGAYERVWAFDLLPTLLLRALVMRDVERVEELGGLELDEEDVALLSFACPGKVEYGPYLREVLTTLEQEG